MYLVIFYMVDFYTHTFPTNKKMFKVNFYFVTFYTLTIPLL